MDFVNYRRLTMKSKIGYGPYADYTVERLMACGRLPLLRQYYYEVSNIDYNEEILEALNIFEDRRIPKPGTNKAFGKEVQNSILEAYGRANIKYGAHRKAQQKISQREKRRSALYRDRLTKGEMQAANHGKMHIGVK